MQIEFEIGPIREIVSTEYILAYMRNMLYKKNYS